MKAERKKTQKQKKRPTNYSTHKPVTSPKALLTSDKKKPTCRDWCFIVAPILIFIIVTLFFYGLNDTAHKEVIVPEIPKFKKLEIANHVNDQVRVLAECDSEDGNFIAVGDFLICRFTNIEDDPLSSVDINVDIYTIINGDAYSDYPQQYPQITLRQGETKTIKFQMVRDGGKGFFFSFKSDSREKPFNTYPKLVPGDTDINSHIFYIYQQEQKQEFLDNRINIIERNAQIRNDKVLQLIIQFLVIIQIFPAALAFKELVKKVSFHERDKSLVMARKIITKEKL